MAIGTTFDSHVLAGYRFLMRYYETGAKIYMFGFSRGAFTARFLARLISTIGLLCKGNEEMIPFAYNLYQRYLTGRIRDLRDAQRNYDKADTQEVESEKPADQSGSIAAENEDIDDPDAPKLSDESQEALNEIQSFSDTFCRKGKDDEKIKVFFLGLWDCVGSVSLLDCKSPIPMPVKGTAHYVRHAVAVDERRVKFKAALFAQDYCRNATVDSSIKDDAKASDDLKTRIKAFFDRLFNSEHMDLVKGAAPQILQDAAGQLQDAAGQLQDATPQILQDAAGQLQNAAEQLQDATPQLLQDAAGQLQDAAPQILQDAAGQLQNVAQQVQEVAQHVVQQVQNAISQSLQTTQVTDGSIQEIEEIKEVWFPGCHGDVGGGWPLEGDATMQISDITLAWMIQELHLIEEMDESAALKWSPTVKRWLRKVEQSATKTATESKIHDSLSFGCGTGFLAVLLWGIMGKYHFYTILS
ncbi:hypothetical protein THARTR1_09548 [Trichoderma harzianum]|uniref:T6SS Phospholipase effector Tle1-like catalytic domain-containing protein n=1 Tax=Trichoderma harzianum TaxID=5544 RepID=A0A2K0TW72_TRIHA|nr:hypothetical protein THARTR1_09548 [Trichoderma harzianum]